MAKLDVACALKLPAPSFEKVLQPLVVPSTASRSPSRSRSPRTTLELVFPVANVGVVACAANAPLPLLIQTLSASVDQLAATASRSPSPSTSPRARSAA